MNNKAIIEFGFRRIWRILQISEDVTPPRPSASVDSTLLDLQNSLYPTRPHSIISKYKDHEYCPITLVIFWGTIKVLNNNKPLSTSEFIGYITNLVKYPPQIMNTITNALTEWNTYKLKKDSASLLPSSKLLSKFKSVLEEQIEGGYLRVKAFI